MLTNREISEKIAEVFEYEKVPSGNGIETDLWLEKNTVSGAFRFSPSTNLQQAMEVAEKYKLVIDFEIMSVLENYDDSEFQYHLVDFKNLEALPRAICEVVLLIEGVEL